MTEHCASIEIQAYRSGFSLIELLVVLMIIGLLAAVSFPLVGLLFKDGQVDSTRMLITAVQTEIANSTFERTITLDSGDVRYMWDIDTEPPSSQEDLISFMESNDKLILDADPQSEGAPASLAKDAPDWYRGFVYHTKIAAPGMIGEDDGLLDAWGQPLRIAYSVAAGESGASPVDQLFGLQGYGIWSVGPDGISDPLNSESDDICSWRLQGGAR